MHLMFGLENLEAIFEILSDWLFARILSISALYQLIATVFGFLIAYVFSKPVRSFLKEHHRVKPRHERIKELLSHAVLALTWIVIQAIIVGISIEFNFNTYVTRTILSLLLVWVLTRLILGIVKDVFLSKLLATSVWVIAVLQIVGLLEPTTGVLSQISMKVGEFKFSVLDLLWGSAVLLLLIWTANAASRQIETRINQRTDLEPTVKVLFNKLLRVSLFGGAILFAISALGIDISALTVFGGALGLGIGFGLQKVISNLICGVILLMDRSIKPGDVICLKNGTTYGTVNQLGARFVSVRTVSGEEHLIPNEDMITQSVENWSYSDRNVLLSLPIRIAMDSDLRRALQVLLECADGVHRVLPFPSPVSRVKAFGEWAIELELLFWVNDPENGLSPVKSDLYLNVWDSFRREGIVIPVPQRIVHMTSEPPALAAVNSCSSIP